MAPAWLVPIVVIVALQTLASFTNRVVPVLYPAIAQEYGWQPGLVGYLATAILTGSLVVLLAGARIMATLGSTRVMQWSLLLAAVSMFLFHLPSLTLLLVGCALLGIASGFAAPASSDVLQRFSPPNRRNLFFSIKQAGVPAGGVLAGLLIAPLVDYAGWRVGVATSALLIAAIVGLTFAWRETGESIVPNPPAARKTATVRDRLEATWATISLPLRSLGCNPELPALCMIAGLLAATQAIWFIFTVIYLVDRLGYSLALAGSVFAVMQAAGIFARIALGWVTDYVGSALPVLLFCSVLSAVSTALMAVSGSQWPVWSLFAVALLGGATVSGWNGVHAAETARRSPPELVTSTAAGSAIVITLANMIAPVIFALLADASGSLALPWWVSVATSMLAVIMLLRLIHRARARQPG